MFDLFRAQGGHRRPAPQGDKDALSWETVRREVSLFQADMLGLQDCWGQFSSNPLLSIRRTQKRAVRDMIEGWASPYLILDPRPGLHIVDVNESFAATTSTKRRRIAGGKLFDLFPENPACTKGDSVSNVFEFFRRTAQERRPRSVAIQRYDIRDASGQFVDRRWQLRSTPILDEEGSLIYLLFNPREL